MHFLTGKTIAIIGGARMGETIAQRLRAAGATIVTTYRKSKTAAQTAGQAFPLDVTSESDRKRFVSSLHKIKPRCFGLVYMASLYEEVPLKGDSLLKAAKENTEIHLWAAVDLIRRLAPYWRSQGGGRAVLFGDWTAASRRPRYKDLLPYYVSKAGAQAAAEALALELAPEILVNTIAPGPILPPPMLSEAEEAAVAVATPLGRWGGPEEIAKAVQFLIETEFVTGETIRVDGGRHLL